MSEPVEEDVNLSERMTKLHLARFFDQFQVERVIRDVTVLRESLLRLLLDPSKAADVRPDCALLLDHLTRLQGVLMLFLDVTDAADADGESSL